MKFKIQYTFFLCILSSINSISQTTIDKVGEEWILKVDGNTFDVKGATFGYDDDVDNYDSYFKELNFLGVNTIRTWGTGENTKALLDAADKHGIKVMLGIWMRHGRPGMEADDSFNYLEDQAGMEDMYSNAIEIVTKYKDHPAVLFWGVGNEVYLNTATDEEKIAYSKLLERICKQIKTIDHKHPIASVEAWTFGLEWWENYVPSLDIYGLNSYGPGAGILSSELTKRNIDKPYVITEFGVMGEWDMPKDKNEITIEPSDQQKYDAIAKGYHDWIESRSNCLGVYVFHYADSNKFLGPWLTTHFNGKTRPQYWAIRKAYTDEEPHNHFPDILSFSLTDQPAKSGIWTSVDIETEDTENEKLNIQFYYNQRTGSRKRRDQLTPLTHRGSLNDNLEIMLPSEHGAIKIYAVVTDEYNNAGIATTSIKVINKKAQQRKFLVPRVELPFYVYRDSDKLPYAPSAYMGDYQAMEVNMNYKDEVHSGETAIQIKYRETSGWYGFGLVDPANDWGNILGGYDVDGAETFSFWAKANITNVKINAGFGLIEDDKTYPDSAKKMQDIVLTKSWEKYTFKVKRSDLSCIRSGFVLFSSPNGFDHEIYIDDIVFE